METVAGIFRTRADAERAVERLRSIGIDQKHISFVTPDTPAAEIEATVPTSDTEQPGVGTAIGAVVGGAAGAAAGPLGAAALSLLVPGVGPVLAIGIAASALFGVGGAIAGAAAGHALEENIEGLPKDELFVYEDALRQGRTVVIATSDESSLATMAREAMKEVGAESVDAARDDWWIGLRSAEEEEYKASGGDFTLDEVNYRKGFEAAQRHDMWGRDYDQAADSLEIHYPELHDSAPFRRGFERGQAYRRRVKGEV